MCRQEQTGGGKGDLLTREDDAWRVANPRKARITTQTSQPVMSFCFPIVNIVFLQDLTITITNSSCSESQIPLLPCQVVVIASRLFFSCAASITMSVTKLAEFGVKHVARGIGRLSNQVLESGAGSYVTTTEGRKMLDFTSGIGVTNLGHCHPAVTKAAQEQVGKLVHGQVNIGKSRGNVSCWSS
jgi:hypothetical protein